MSYELQFTAKDDHIDYQGIMDGLYYPFYMEECRHRYIEEILRFDMKAHAARGINMVLAQYTIRFRRPLRRGDSFSVSCSAHPAKNDNTRWYFRQEIRRDRRIVTDGEFVATCVPAAGGNPFIPDEIAAIIKDSEPLGD